MKPLLSVVMPTYNGEQYIAAALESVQQQNSDDIEVVVADDSSSDNTREIVRGYESLLRIKLLTPPKAGNWVAMTNVALKAATGDWACFLHQDDLWLPGRMAKIREQIARAPGKMVLHNAEFVGPDGCPLGPWTCPFTADEIPSNEFVERLLVQNFIAIPSPVFKRNAAVDSGGLDESLWFTADWDLWLRLGSMGPVKFTTDRLAAFRVHGLSQTASRKLSPGDWENQLTTVFDRHFSADVPIRNRQRVRKLAAVSVCVNSELAAASRGLRARPARVLVKLLGLGPAGLRRYLKDSRITERVRSRMKVRKKLF